MDSGKRTFSRRSCWDSNSQPFDHEPGALTNKLSRFPEREERKKGIALAGGVPVSKDTTVTLKLFLDRKGGGVGGGGVEVGRFLPELHFLEKP